MNPVRTVLVVAAIVSASLVAGGCGNKQKQASAADGGVLDVTASQQPAPAVYAPISAQPAGMTQPAIDEAPMMASAGPASGGKYTVQRGDTLWKIASMQYGDGKQWQRIASANPGVTPQSLKVGQTIMIP